MKQTRTQTLVDVFVHYGSITLLARELHLTPAAVSAWKHVPIRYLAKISKETGIDRQKLRPDLYGDD
jgi:hypothetical protein